MMTVNAIIIGYIYVVIMRDPMKREHPCMAFESEADAMNAVGQADRRGRTEAEGCCWYYVQIPAMKMNR